MEELKIRDLRKKEQFVVDDVYLNGYAKLCGIYATGVYLSLCRHADKQQKSFPSLKKISEELDISIKQVGRSLNVLESHNIIMRERMGKKLNNRYYLLDKSEWTNSPISERTDSPITVDSQSNHIGTDSPIHSKDTHIKDTHSKDIATQSVAGIKDINDLIELFKSVNPSYGKFFGNKTQRAAIERLLKAMGREKLEGAIKILAQTNKVKYAPSITTPLQLEDKMGALIVFIQKEKNNKNEIAIL
jgi:hypothetical protein